MSPRGSAAIVTTATAIGSGLNFAATLLWTRLLEPSAFGLYALVSAAAMLLNGMLFEWLRLVAARTLYAPLAPRNIDSARADALVALYAAVALLLVAAAALLSLLDVGVAGLAARWWPIMATFALSEAALTLLQTIQRIRLRAWAFFWNAVARSLLALLVGVALVVGAGMEARGALLGIVVAQGAVAAVSALADPLWRAARPWRAARAPVAAALRLGYPLIASCALAYAASVADRFLLGATLGPDAVGLYAAPVDLLQKTLVFLMMTINLTGYPTLVRAYEEGGVAAARAVLQANLELQLGLALPAAVGLAVLAPGIVALLLGPAFRTEGVRLLPLVAGATLLRCLVTFHLMMAFQVTQRMAWMIVPPLATLAVLVPAGLVGARLAGLPGMALAALAAQAASFAAGAVLAKRALPLRLVTATTVRISIAVVGMGLALAPFRHHAGALATVALVAVGATLYVALLMALRVPAVIALVGEMTGRIRGASR